MEKQATRPEERIHAMIVAAAARAIAARDPSAAPDMPGEAAITRSEKLGLLDRLNDLGGTTAVLEAGQTLKGATESPLLAAILNSDSIGVLLDKLADLNRYFHSHHRHSVVRLSDRALVLDHVSTDGEPPLAIESLFTCGLYIALLEEIGCLRLTCRLASDGGPQTLAYRDGAAPRIALAPCSRWHFAWDDFAPRRPLPGIDAMVRQHLPPDLSPGTLGERIRAILAADLARKWRIAEVADRLAVSRRSLQRHLRDEGSQFSQLLAEARLDAARTLLRETAEPITTIGYICGFADTAHFTRTFKATTTMTPSAWRSAQARRPAAT